MTPGLNMDCLPDFLDEGLETTPLASLKLGGVSYSFSLSDMRRSADSYSAYLPGGLTVALDFQKLDAKMLRWTVRLKNDGTRRTAQITEFYGMDLSLPVTENVTWESLHGDICGAESFLPQKEVLSQGETLTREAAGGRSSQGESFPYFDLTCGGWSAVFAVGWTGQWRYTIARDESSVRLRAGFTDCDFYLEPGEQARSVGILLYMDRDLLSARQGFRRAFRGMMKRSARWTDKPDDAFGVCTVQVFDRYFRKEPLWATTEGQLRCIKRSTEIGGFNAYWLDAAWFRDGFPTGVGNYDFDPGFPQGLWPVSGAAHDAQLRFVVWFEPERVDIGSDTAREHPEFLLDDGREGERNRLFNLADDEARSWLTDTLVRFIRTNGVDVYRQDFNMDPLEYWRRHDAPGRRGYTENRYITGLYALWDALAAEIPGLVIDNCSSGGRRLDWEMLSRSIPLWRSDTGCSPETEKEPKSVWNQNQTLGLTRYLPYHSCAVWTEKAYAFRSVATMSVACNFDVLAEDYDVEAAKKALHEFELLSPYWSGDFFPLTEAALADDRWAAFQLAVEGRTGGVCYFFRRKNAPEAAAFRLNGIDPDGTYVVQLRREDYSVQEKTMVGTDLLDYTAVIDEGNQSLILRYRPESGKGIDLDF